MKYLTEDQKEILRQAYVIASDLADELLQKDSELEYYAYGTSGNLKAYDIRESAEVIAKLTGQLKRYKSAEKTNQKIISVYKERLEELNKVG